MALTSPILWTVKACLVASYAKIIEISLIFMLSAMTLNIDEGVSTR
jgi:hypothetical protein